MRIVYESTDIREATSKMQDKKLYEQSYGTVHSIDKLYT
jgi:hypothetical protein